MLTGRGPARGADATDNPLFVMGWVSDENQLMLESHFGKNGTMIFQRSFSTIDEAKRWRDGCSRGA